MEVDTKTLDGKQFHVEEPVSTAHTQATAPRSQIMKEAEEFKPPENTMIESCIYCFCCCLMVIPGCYCQNLQTIQEYEKGVVLRMGKRTHAGVKSGGVHLILPSIDQLIKVSVREIPLNIAAQTAFTLDGLQLNVDTFVFYQVFDPNLALLEVRQLELGIRLLAQTKMREVIAHSTYEQIQRDRVLISQKLSKLLDDATAAWGVDVTRVEFEKLSLPQEAQAAMALEAETRRTADANILKAKADREVKLIQANSNRETQLIGVNTRARTMQIDAQASAAAKLVEAAGEEKAAVGFKEAAEIMSEAPGTYQLRFMQTMGTVSKRPGNTIMVPFDAQGLNSIVRG
jgi:regulator of protease activity HflC (stomatin/prohibitin superfamily)